MASPDATKVIRAQGRLVANPTDLTAAFPYGGTALGATKGVVLRNSERYFPIVAEELGGEPVEYLERGEAWWLAAFLRGVDDDALATLFPNTAAGTTTQHRGVSGPGSVKAGMRVSGRSLKLLFAPLDTDRVPMVVLYRALPLVEESAEILMQRGEEFGFPVAFMGIRDTTGRTFAMKRKEDLSL